MKFDTVIIYASFYPFYNAIKDMILFALKKKKQILFYPEINSDRNFDEQIRMIRLGIKELKLKKESFSIAKKSMVKKGLESLISNLEGVQIYLADDCLSSFKEKFKLSIPIYYYPCKETISSKGFKKLPLEPLNYTFKDILKGSQLEAPIAVLNEIVEKKLFFAKELSLLLKESRYLHSLSVAKTAVKIVQKNHLSIPIEKAYQAGLFHDCGKNIPIEKQYEYTTTYYSQYKSVPSFAYHQYASAVIAKNQFNIEDKEILDAIACHCLGKGNMGSLDKIIYLADKVEPRRKFPTKELRIKIYHNYEKGFVLNLKNQKEYFEKNNIPYLDHSLTIEMYKNYLGVKSC